MGKCVAPCCVGFGLGFGFGFGLGLGSGSVLPVFAIDKRLLVIGGIFTRWVEPHLCMGLHKCMGVSVYVFVHVHLICMCVCMHACVPLQLRTYGRRNSPILTLALSITLTLTLSLTLTLTVPMTLALTCRCGYPHGRRAITLRYRFREHLCGGDPACYTLLFILCEG